MSYWSIGVFSANARIISKSRGVRAGQHPQSAQLRGVLKVAVTSVVGQPVWDNLRSHMQNLSFTA